MKIRTARSFTIEISDDEAGRLANGLHAILKNIDEPKDLGIDSLDQGSYVRNLLALLEATVK